MHETTDPDCIFSHPPGTSIGSSRDIHLTKKKAFLIQAQMIHVKGILWLGMLGILSCQTQFPQELRQPNIIMILSDDHATQAISAYGSTLIQTPHIDRLASESVLFENCFSTNAICNPSRASILTGKYSHIHGVKTNYITPGNEHITYPELLKSAGYQTALIGKTHFRKGTNLIESLDHYVISQGAEYHDPKFLEKGGVVKNYEGYVTDIVTQKGIDWMESCDRSKPFLLLLHHPAPHMPFQEKEELQEKYADRVYPEPLSFDDTLKNQEDSPRPYNITMEGLLGFQGREQVWGEYAWKAPGGMEGEERRHWIYQRLMRAYMACIETLDKNVGSILDYLKETGLEEHTIVIYTSDQGFFLGEHGWYDKRFFYEESIRMPLIIRCPGVKGGSRAEEMVLNIDMAETIIDLAGIEAPEDMQGESLVPLFENKPQLAWRDAMYYHYYESREDSPLPVMRHFGIRTGRHKLICFYNDELEHLELYDLEMDPYEMNNLIHQVECQDLIMSLRSRLEVLQEEYKDSTSIYYKHLND